MIYADGNQTWDFRFIYDVSKQTLQSEEMEFGIYDIGTGIQTSFSRLVEIINRHLRTNIQTVIYVGNLIKTLHKIKADIMLAKLAQVQP